MMFYVADSWGMKFACVCMCNSLVCGSERVEIRLVTSDYRSLTSENTAIGFYMTGWGGILHLYLAMGLHLLQR